jgi:hypothetical protein
MTARRQADAQSRRVDDADFAQRLRAERVSLVPAGRGLSPLRDASSRTLYVLLGMMAVLLIIASGNVAGLLARASSRERELAVRLSLVPGAHGSCGSSWQSPCCLASQAVPWALASRCGDATCCSGWWQAART